MSLMLDDLRLATLGSNLVISLGRLIRGYVESAIIYDRAIQRRYKENTLLENVGYDVPNYDPKDHYTVMNYPDFNGEMVDIAVDINIALTTNIKLKLFLNESVVEPIHFLAKIEQVPTKETKKFISFSFDDENKAQVNRASCDMEVKRLK
ncbi:hypothetical protein J1N35_037057, partial [Gossypium stocksii]